MELTAATAPPGWYADPWGHAWWRWWDGTAWTGYTDAWFAAAATLAPYEPGTPIRAGWTALLGMIVGLGCSTAIVVALVLLGFDVSDPVLILGSTVGLWAGLFGACRIAVRRKGSGSLRDLGLVRFRWIDLALGLGFGVATVFAVGALAQALEALAPDLVPHGRNDIIDPLSGDSGFGIAVIVLIAVVGAPFFEELFFRGLVQGGLVARWGVAVGVIVQALLFAVVHLSPDAGWGNVGIFLMISVVGLGLGFIRFGFRRLGPGMLTHAVYNAVIVGVAIALR